MLDRPEWDDYFMALALVVSQRSLDPATKCGTVVVDDDKTVLSVGYNSPPRGCVDENVPLTRPEKYDWMVHSEDAAIINAARKGVGLNGSTFYVTGPPCERCTRSIISVGAAKVVYGRTSAKCVTEDREKIKAQMLEGQSVEFVFHPTSVVPLLESAITYYKNKIKGE